MNTNARVFEECKELLHALRVLESSKSPSIDKSYVEEMFNNVMKELFMEATEVYQGSYKETGDS